MQIRSWLGKTLDEMGALVGVSGRSWQDYEGKKAVPKVSVYEALHQMGFNPAWLLGEEDATMRLLGSGALLEAGASAAEGFVALPRYGVEAAAGAGASTDDDRVADYVHFRRDWLRRTVGISPSRLVTLGARGDSMSETISDGDLLIVDTSEPRFRRDGIYVLAVDDGLIVKRVALRLAGGIRISSDNPLYPETMELAGDEASRRVRIVGRVVWVGGTI